MRKSKVLPFEYEVLKLLSSIAPDWKGKKLLVAFSGGRDSTVLLNALFSIQSRLGFELSLAYVHHGPSSDKKISAYRSAAAAKSEFEANEKKLPFYFLKNETQELTSEAQFRELRNRLLKECAEQGRHDFIVYAHHADDLLETRLIRLIRGTGAQGLNAMSVAKGKTLRPLLTFSSTQIADYAEQTQLKWVNDPTNSSDQYFRNWLRNAWLPLLEQKRKGSLKSLQRSLEVISDSLGQNDTSKARLEVIKRKEFASLSVTQKREVLARVMLDHGAKDFSRRQIDEILKRLCGSRKSNQRKMSFEVGGLTWLVNAEQIEAVRL